jgi:rhamnose transport system substrate-binding protein
MDRGITVISWDSGIAEEGRVMNLDPSNTALIGSSNIKWMKNSMGDEGEFAILSATSQATNQNAWIEEMKKEFAKPEYSKMKWVDTVYGDDLFDKSYQEALGLFKKHPNLKGIIAPTSVGIVAAAKAVEDQGLVGKVFVTGLGLPSEMKAHVKNGSAVQFGIWNPIDLGYSAVYLSHQIATGAYSGQEGECIPVGRMGEICVGAGNNAAMADPFIFDASNIDKFAEIF